MTMTDGDTAYHLPAGEVVITMARSSKGDMRIDPRDGQIRFMPMTIAQALYDFEILHDGHLSATDRFSAWRRMLAVAIGADRINADLSGDGEGGVEEKYIVLVRRMPKHDMQIVTQAVDNSGLEIARRLALLRKTDGVNYSYAKRSLRNNYAEAFDSLEKVMKDIK